MSYIMHPTTDPLWVNLDLNKKSRIVVFVVSVPYHFEILRLASSFLARPNPNLNRDPSVACACCPPLLLLQLIISHPWRRQVAAHISDFARDDLRLHVPTELVDLCVQFARPSTEWNQERLQVQ